MIQLTVNGKPQKLEKSISVKAYLEQENYKLVQIAVELNEVILSKSQYEETLLKEGDILEVLSFVGGG
jgi:thiamine biosynthesis protein ThiS